MSTKRIPIFTVTSHIKAIRLAHKIMRENNYKYGVEVCSSCKKDAVSIYIWEKDRDYVISSWHTISMQECISTLNKILKEGVKTNE